MKKRIFLVLAALLVLLFALGTQMTRRDAPAPSPEPSAPAEEAPTPTPHIHDFLPETGVCRTCGGVCGHEAGFDAAGVCSVCGWQCPHNAHDPETACCLLCGAQCAHHFGAAGLCDCGREAPLVLQRLEEQYYEPSAHPGTCLRETLTDEQGRQISLSIWLPWDYSEENRYNVALLLHGDGGACDDWTDREHQTALGPIRLCTVYDHMTEEHLCQPFLVVGMENRWMENPEVGEKLIRETVLPYLAQHYATWMGDGSKAEIAAAREHIAIGGLSRGSMYAYSVGMGRCLDLAANFCCFSVGYQPGLVQTLEGETCRDLPIRCYFASVGLRDNPEYIRPHRQHYEILCRDASSLRDGENARFLEIDEGHDYLMWSASIYDALLLMF